MLMTSRCYNSQESNLFLQRPKLKTMNFLGNKSSFYIYRKHSEQESNHEQAHPDHEKLPYILSQNSSIHDQNQQKMGSFSNDNQSSLLKEESQEYQCITCNRTYDGFIKCRHTEEKSSQSSQEIKNINSKVYSCPYDKCEKKFNLESGLVRHKVVHTGEKPYSCDYENCAQSFNQKSNLNRHKKIHKNEKPFICNKCCKSFTTTTNLKQHSQTHIPKKQERKHYTCEMKGCNKKYLYRCNLKKHKMEHDDPVGALMVENENQRNISKARFQIGLSQCNVSLQLKEPSIDDHSEMKIVYDEKLASNGQVYDPSFIIPTEEKEEKSLAIPEQPKLDLFKIEENIIRNLEEFFINKNSQISISFYIHPELMQFSHVVISQVITLLQEKGTKEIRFFVETKQNFSRCAQNLLQIFFLQNKPI